MTMTDDLMPCPFCGETPFPISTGMAGQPRWQHPNNDTCPIAGHYLGGWNMPEQWNRRTVQAQIDAAREGVLQEAALAVKECLFDENLPLSPHGIELNAVVYECHSAILALIRKGDQP